MARFQWIAGGRVRKSYWWPAIISLAAATGAVANPGFTVEDLLKLHRVSDIQISPDERFVAMTLATPDVETNGQHLQLWLLDLGKRGGEPRALINNSAHDWNARWAPDGKSVYFLSDRSGSSQVWRLILGTSTPTQVTRLPLDVETLKVSPLGDRLLLSMEVFGDCPDLDCSAQRASIAQKSPGAGRVYDRLFVRHWDRWGDGRQSHLFSVALTGGEGTAGSPVDLTRTLDADVPSKPFGSDSEFNFSPDGALVAFTARIKGQTEAWSTNFDVFEVSADGRDEPRNLTATNPAWDSEPVYSPDGRLLVWKSRDRPQNEADRFHIVVKDRHSGSVQPLLSDWDRSVDQLAFARDGHSLFATTDHLGQHVLWRIDLRGGSPRTVQSDGQIVDFATTAQSIVFARATLDSPPDLFRSRLDGTRVQRLTNLNEEILRARSLGTFEQFTFQGWNDERVYAYIVRPPDFQATRKYPIAFIAHGGPQLSYANGWSYRWNPQVYSGAGYAVVMIDFHGSTGYGQAFTDSIRGDWGGKPLVDLQKGLAAALAKYPWLDGEHACALGASYSGEMMNWIEGNWPNAFRCLVNYAGPFDTRSMYYQTDEMWLDEFEMSGPQFVNPDSYERHNPLLYVAKWRTPMLVGHGLQDFNVPYDQGIAAFTALQRRAVPSRLIIFPDEGHFIVKPRDSLQWHHEAIGWLDRWLKHDGTETK